jgi:MoxR-like ATPase
MNQDSPTEPVKLPPSGGRTQVHVFDDTSVWAIRAALAANRPLLVRGEPGVGKSQLAQGAAVWLGRPFLSVVADIRTESQDLLWTFDAVHRLAQAQICGALKSENHAALLAESNFVRPGPLWWAFDWASALERVEVVGDSAPSAPQGWNAGDGAVLLIDEIDKAESDVPNGLLEALGTGSFPVRGRKEPVAVKGKAPLVVITTNEDRVLPNAFVRRCLVLHLQLPETDDQLREFLVARGQAHQPKMKKSVLQRAADVLVEERNAARAQQLRPLPGQAEYLDLIRAVSELAAGSKGDQERVLEQVKTFVLRKSAGSPA